ncbi:type II secretion system minor pseudopilin GspI [Marinomonas sp. 2405UD68-3]|uniref:type II secretion system minor pseudopilin GspI n=1 Tax=Marinomonas sp. 2405UD68-3 TaxID=3391835 RepID=UPI0039C924C7
MFLSSIMNNKKARLRAKTSFQQASQHGFTLIEVLIALVIIGLVGMMLAQTSFQSVDQSDYLKRKLIASWVAENRINDLRLLSQQGVKMTLDEGVVEQGSWVFRTLPELKQQTAGVARIEINVFQPPESTSSLFTLIGYLPSSVASSASNSASELSSEGSLP